MPTPSTSYEPTSSSAARIFVSRVPIVDRHSRVLGYELVVRPPSGESQATGGPSDGRASARAIADALLGIGLDSLADGRLAFVNVGRQMLVEGLTTVLPAAKVIVELASDPNPSEDVIEGCQLLKKAGYKLALDDYEPEGRAGELLPFADYVKIDVNSPSLKHVRVLAASAHAPIVVAKGIDSVEKFSQAMMAGATHFQGYFFGRPAVSQGRAVVGGRLQHLQLLRALDNENLSVGHLEELVKHDAALVHRILRTVNSAGFGLRSTVKSIRDALVMLGRNTIRRWVVLWSIAGLNDQAPPELIAMSCIRGRFCELLATKANQPKLAAEGFLVGMCSLLDEILEQPMAQVIEGLPLEPEAKDALLGKANPMRDLIDASVAYERGDWETCDRLAQVFNVPADSLPSVYADALKWTRELKQVA